MYGLGGYGVFRFRFILSSKTLGTFSTNNSPRYVSSRWKLLVYCVVRIKMSALFHPCSVTWTRVFIVCNFLISYGSFLSFGGRGNVRTSFFPRVLIALLLHRSTRCGCSRVKNNRLLSIVPYRRIQAKQTR